MEEQIINRVANSGLITLNLEDFYPKEEIIDFDLKDYLFHGLILKEKDFRTSLKEIDWTKYEGSVLVVFCSADAIIPVWAYMLVAKHAEGKAKEIFIGSKEDYLKTFYRELINGFDPQEYEGQKLVIKGCSNKPVPPSAYANIVSKLQPVAKSIMYGEPCSTVPIYKRPRSR